MGDVLHLHEGHVGFLEANAWRTGCKVCQSVKGMVSNFNPVLESVDLAGNSYYYFRSALGTRPRRILQQNPSVPYSDINIPVQWHQWLRYTRPSAPSVQELQIDVQRKEQLKQLAAAADERWASKPSVLDAPRRRNQEIGVGDGEGQMGVVGRRGESAEGGDEAGGERLGKGVKGEDVRDSWGEGRKGRGENPWIKKRPSGPGEEYQPSSWQPPG
ncbi:MAG: hypothetical protein L6R39_005651 [Caloplaca ligustica]|nr:MAG: hypothetical protein L6R39_005651 [Caloplaca ligustica]